MTVRLNRTVGASKFLTSNKELIGSFDYACDGNVHIVKLHDNAVANNWQTYSPLHAVKIAGGMSTKGSARQLAGYHQREEVILATVCKCHQRRDRSCLGHTLQGRAATFVTFRIPTAGDNVCCKQKCLTMKFGSVEPQLGGCLIPLIYVWTGSNTHFVNVHKGDAKCAGRIPRIYVANVIFSCMPKEEKGVCFQMYHRP
ncbi:hypothetical protein T02_8303 [Trichinella nativa]|uniref:Uncharacterized protein n=1 Tax=Trichinella nativa TaxID=6335 RepID=A0A0V1KZA2_9BILA|nr:hypothetical protein T02_8303 [Trichinella nativa]